MVGMQPCLCRSHCTQSGNP